ncbi:PD-(D/E)XK nuclease family protein [Anaeromyxobacter sp. SG66]|uniref:PD-(D/E)XK nuclease family protein n=1 Tax=Anaeromyxobacter sp. SG66 TaxID=2925410 RepID=UPI001F5A036F|nr:PD-(D/E)XK nuclease family protein [Anaeromyxobacter sp. SG66]
MSHPILWTLADWARAVAAPPAEGALPQRTVIVPSERHAHALRCELVRAGAARALAGTRFLGPLTAASEVLHAGSVPLTLGEDELRPARLVTLLAEDLPLDYFDLELVRRTRGWDVALARAIGELESAGLGPSDLPTDEPRARDLALLWSRLDAAGPSSFSRARVYREATRLLAKAWPHRGPVLAVVTGHESAVQAAFLRSIPSLTLAVQASSPRPPGLVNRVRALYGDTAADALARAEPPADDGSERGLLARYLFGDVDALADPARRRSAAPDGTVALEEHAGVDEELDAAADWVAREIADRGTPLERIAVLVPSLDPLSPLVASRLGSLPWRGGAMPVHVAGGLPVTATAAGARALAVLRALNDHLSAASLAAVLPSLRCEGDRGHLSHGEAMELAFSLGTVGGNGARPEGALEWASRAAAREAELTDALARERTDEDSAERERWRLERALENLRAVRPALLALVEVARARVEDRPLRDVWEALHGFLRDWLLAPGEGISVAERLDATLAGACAGAIGDMLRGPDALELVQDHLSSLRERGTRFGHPAVYVGTIAGAAGLAFDAVRVVGLCEGTLPPAPREDPVLPGALRARLGLPGPALRVTAELQALHRVILAASRVVLSAPRADLSRTEREPSSVFIEAAAALGRPNAATGERTRTIPDLEAIRRDAFAPARTDAARWRASFPVGDARWLARIADGVREFPPGWRAEAAVDLARLAALARRRVEGKCDPTAPFPRVPGIDPTRPISASALGTLLSCPGRFLKQRILGWDEPAAAPSVRELDALAYGSLFHLAAERFYREHGAAFVAGDRTLGTWLKRSDAIAEEAFAELLREHPLAGVGPRARELRRLREDLRSFLRYDWEGREGRTFHGVELPFGEREPVALDLGDGLVLHVRGYVDRVDIEGGVTLVRDLKTGKPHPRVKDEAGPVPGRDVQLGLYSLVVAKLAGRWGIPKKVQAAYAYADGRGHPERAFREDAKALVTATKEWLRISAGLLAARSFPSTPVPKDCEWCPFTPACGDEAPAVAAEALADEDGPLAAFRDLKLGTEEIR